MASGTIGAARIAAAWGIPAIAVSGFDDSTPDAVTSLADWVVRLAQSSLVRGLSAGQYLTVSFPRTNPSEFKGVRVAERAGVLLDFRFDLIPSDTSGELGETWALQRPRAIPAASAESDAALYEQGYVVIVPMLADEHDHKLLSRLRASRELLPEWPNFEESK